MIDDRKYDQKLEHKTIPMTMISVAEPILGLIMRLMNDELADNCQNLSQTHL
jgi:hypothetical protein